MKKLFAVLAAIFLLVVIACSGGGGGDSTGSSSNGNGTVGSTGGSVEVSDQTSPIYETKVVVPAGAVDSNVNISISYSEQLPGPVESNVFSASKVIVLSKDSKKDSNKDFLLPVTITIPYIDSQMSENDIPGVYYWDPTINRYLPLTITDIDTSNKKITFITNHLSSYVSLFIKDLGSSKGTEQIDYDSHFTSAKDGFYQGNFNYYYPSSATKGTCYALASYAIWYYAYKKSVAGSLYDQYRDGDPYWRYDDTRARELIARAYDGSYMQNREDYEAAASWRPFKGSDLGRLLIQNLGISGFPSLLSIRFNDWSGHTVAVNRYVGDSDAGIFYIYDSNFPGEVPEPMIQWNRFDGFYNYSKASAYPPIINYGVNSNISEHQDGTYEYLYLKAKNGGWNSTESIFKTIDITSPILTNNTATASGNNTISGFVRSGSVTDMGTDTNKLKLYYSLNTTDIALLYTDNPTIINNDGSFSFNIGPLPLSTTSIRIFVGYISPANPAKLVFAGFREITLTTQAPPVSPPSTPADFNVTAASSSQINLAWIAPTGTVEGYKVYKKGTFLKSVTTTLTSDTGLSPSTPYCYSVTAYNSAGESAPTSQLCDTTPSVTSVYIISGQITGAVVSGVTVTLTGTGSTSQTTDPSGNYSFINAANGNYTVTPSKTGYTFSPASRSITVNNANITGKDFTATASTTPTYTISGMVSGAVVSGVTITLTGTGSTSRITDPSGNYSFIGAASGSYTITPSMTGYTFSPANRTANVSGANVTVPDFVATAVAAIPSVPTSLSPGLTSSPGPTLTSSSVTVSWNASSRAISYMGGIHDIAADIDVVTINTSGTSTTATLSSGKQYRWYVYACNSSGCSSSSALYYFQTPSAPLVTPTLYSISPSTITQGSSYQYVTFNGSNFTTSSWHQYSVSGGSSWAWATFPPTFNNSTSMTVAVNNTLVQTIYWRVCASDVSTLCSESKTVKVQAAPPVEIIVDDQSSGFTKYRYNPATPMPEALIGYNGHMYYVNNTQNGAFDYAIWTPSLSGGSGTYAVYVYVPNNYANTTNAVYSIYHNGTINVYVINQSANPNSWALLGSYYFAASGGEYVKLTDYTGETSSSKYVAFDAIKWVKQ